MDEIYGETNRKTRKTKKDVEAEHEKQLLEQLKSVLDLVDEKKDSKRKYTKKSDVWTDEYKKKRGEQLNATRKKAIENSVKTRATKKKEKEVEKAKKTLEKYDKIENIKPAVVKQEETTQQEKKVNVQEEKNNKIKEQEVKIQTPKQAPKQAAPKQMVTLNMDTRNQQKPKEEVVNTLPPQQKDVEDETARKKKEYLAYMKRSGLI